jgi:hypothetical protein
VSAKRWVQSRDPRCRTYGDGMYSMAHMLPWTDPRSDWMRGRPLQVTDAGPGWRWGKQPRKRAA